MAQTTTAAAAATMMSGGGRFEVGEYVVENQIGWGSFSTVWRANHRVHGTEVAIKEIAMARLDKKLQESLKSEIVILKKIDHPNIIRLHDMIEEPGKIYIVLEYCKGGDLSLFIQKRQGRIPEATAKHFMQQLASGLKILRENNLIHRDLKPQNLLLSTNDDNSILKIADFGFARSLQPRGLAETLCGSPLYMAPEIMQHQKYDAKADLWSVGTILFQLVTGKTPFTGNNHIQLLQNIVKSTGLQFPPDLKDLSPECIDLCRKLLRCNPVERLTFEEFFNHPFLSQWQPDEILRNWRSQRVTDGFPISDVNPVRNSELSSKEGYLPYGQAGDSSGCDGSSSVIRTLPLKITYGFSLDAKADNKQIITSSNKPDLTSESSSLMHNPEAIGSSLDSHQLLEGKLKESLKPLDCRPVSSCPKEADSLVLVDHDYVLVTFPTVDSLSSVSAPVLKSSPSTSGSLPLPSRNVKSTSRIPESSISPAPSKVGIVGNFESDCFAPKTPEVSMDILDALEQPFTDCMTRPKSLNSLKRCASAITELVNEKTQEEKQLEAFSIQLLILAIWKQALDISHIQAASAVKGSPTQVTPRVRKIVQERGTPDIGECPETADMLGPVDICSEIERALLIEIGNAEELAKAIEPGVTKMPDAMEIIYQAALDLGKYGAVKEYMDDAKGAEVCYSKAVLLFIFLLVEAPSLIVNPPFSLTNSDRDRIQDYINLLSIRQSIVRSKDGSPQVRRSALPTTGLG